MLRNFLNQAPILKWWPSILLSENFRRNTESNEENKEKKKKVEFQESETLGRKNKEFFNLDAAGLI